MQLTNNSFFANLIENEYIDSLTSLINKTYILKYINYLIDNNMPFSLSLIDVDNFKLINDNYGHYVGDLALAQIGESLNDYFSGNEVIGRFGGDEFIVVAPNVTSYDESHSVIGDMFNSGKVFRRRFYLENNQIYITATSGTAAFPNDAKSYDELMLRVDQALYRGKVKGRNCYIVYVKEKHENINCKIVAKINMNEALEKVDEIIATNSSFDTIYKLADYARQIFDLTTLIIREDDMAVMNNQKFTLTGFKENKGFDNVLKDKSYAGLYKIDEFTSLNPSFREKVVSEGYYSALVQKIQFRDYSFGYLVLLDERRERLWHESELTVSHYISKMLAVELYYLSK